MKNSQYTNQMVCGIAEMARITFWEKLPDGSLHDIVTLSMNPEFLKEVYSVIGKTLEQHMEAIAKLQQNKEVN